MDLSGVKKHIVTVFFKEEIQNKIAYVDVAITTIKVPNQTTVISQTRYPTSCLLQHKSMWLLKCFFITAEPVNNPDFSKGA